MVIDAWGLGLTTKMVALFKNNDLDGGFIFNKFERDETGDWVENYISSDKGLCSKIGSSGWQLRLDHWFLGHEHLVVGAQLWLQGLTIGQRRCSLSNGGELLRNKKIIE